MTYALPPTNEQRSDSMAHCHLLASGLLPHCRTLLSTTTRTEWKDAGAIELYMQYINASGSVYQSIFMRDTESMRLWVGAAW